MSTNITDTIHTAPTRKPDSSSTRAAFLAVAVAALVLGLSGRTTSAQFLSGAPREVVTNAPTEATAETIAKLLAAPRPAVAIKAQDALAIQVFEVKRYDYSNIRVAEDGTVTLPLIDAVKLEGLTVAQAENVIAQRLQDSGMVKSPHVHVAIDEQPSQMFTVAGDVDNPGAFSAFGRHTLLGAIAQAGGFKENASRNVTLVRPGDTQGYILNLGPNPAGSAAAAIPVYQGDTVVVGTAGVFYVVGAVKTNGVYKMKNSSPTTAFQAVTMAGGAGYEAKLNEAEIVRIEGGKRYEFMIDLKRIERGEAADPVLAADDILFIPSQAFKAALKGNGAGIAASLAAAALYRY
jgi:polysaccharide biosynthesis/export protein